MKQLFENWNRFLSEDEDDIEGFNLGVLEDIVQGEFQAWLKEQEDLRRKGFQPGMGAGGNAGKADTQRSQVFHKVKRALIQADYGFMDDVEAWEFEQAGKHVDEEKVIGVGKPIYEEIYTILYDLIPRTGPGRY